MKFLQMLACDRVTHLSVLLLHVMVFIKCISSQQSTNNEVSNKVICYYGSWSHWRSYPGQLSPSSIDPYLCTHLIYSFAKIHPSTFQITPSDETLDLNDNTWSADGYNKFNALKQVNPALKTQISIGGWNEGSRVFSNLVHNDTAIDVFIESLINFFNKYSFDGIDIDWEYPGQRDNSRTSDPFKFEYFLRELRASLPVDRYIISIAVPGSEYIAQKVYPSDSIFDLVDHVHLMTYDYYGPWTYIVGHTAPLFSRSSVDTRSINSSLIYWLNRVSNDKLFLGISLYGRTFKLFNSTQFTPLSLSDGEGVTGSISKIPGVLSYYESCTFIDDPNTIKIWDYKWSTPYAVNDDQWVSLEDVTSIQAKATYIKVNDIAGAVIWSLDHDDVTGMICHQSKYKNGKKYYKSHFSRPFPLTSIVSETLLAADRWKVKSVNNLIDPQSSTPTTVIYVSDLTDDADDDKNCSPNCRFTEFDSEVDQLNTQSNEIIVTNVTFHNLTASSAPGFTRFHLYHLLTLFILHQLFCV